MPYLAFAVYDTTLITPFEHSKGLKTATVEECFAYYQLLAQKFPQVVQLVQPQGQPFPLVLVKGKLPEEDRLVIMINNAIHPGEPDGVDASMMLVRDICTGKITLHPQMELRIIPFYNVAGGLRRGKYSRVNQDGPIECGFRANGQNLDLNRDLMKGDAMETRWFKEVFLYNGVSPDLFIETHVSNGADYQHTLTVLSTQHNQLSGVLGVYQHDSLMPAVYNMLRERKIEACPYVNHFSTTPDSGWVEFFDLPRFSSGYASLNNCMAILAETHMLKPFKQRVENTCTFLEVMLTFCGQHKKEIKDVRIKQWYWLLTTTLKLPLDWEIDSSQYSLIHFKGYHAAHKPSSVSDSPRLYYDRNKPYERIVKFYDTYKPTLEVSVPKMYLVPLGYIRVIEQLRQNGMFPSGLKESVFPTDTFITVTVYHIDSFKTVNWPYEGHYFHYHTVVSRKQKRVFISGGTYVMMDAQNPVVKKFLVNVFEPSAPDSYFNWNFFDGILQQKEGYSDYVFEDIAAELLKKDTVLCNEFETLKEKDVTFAANPKAQLDWIYKHSVYYEGTVNEYPVYLIY